MEQDRQNVVVAGVGYGILAGILFALAQMAAAAWMGASPLWPLRLIASVVLWRQAFTTISLAASIPVAIVVHLVISAFYGGLYGLAFSTFAPELRRAPGAQAALGVVFGIGVWLVNFEIIARFLYPWFLSAPQGIQASLHAAFFGLPLGLLFARSEQRVRPPV